MDSKDSGKGSKELSRRKILRAAGLLAATVPLRHLLACASETGSTAGDGTDGGTGTGTGATDGSTATDAVASADVPWATGGTASMTDAASYPDPFANGLGSTCELYCQATLGPCYAETVERKDITEGEPGLPTRLVFLLVDESCKPIPGATLDIWHCGPDGLYSGSDASDFCTTGDARARAARWYRGVQTSDANGRVEFDTCFPGWYSSRTIHIHFTVRLNGNEYVTSQIVFDDALDDEIVANQPLYSTRGARDTKNTTDNVVGGESDMSKYTFQTARMTDGAMLAWKALVIRSSTTADLCSIAGAGGGGGGGGQPPGGGGAPPDGGPPNG